MVDMDEKLENGELIYFEFVTKENKLYPAHYKSYANYVKKDNAKIKIVLALIEKVKVARAFI